LVEKLKFVKRSDIIIIAVIAVISLAAWFGYRAMAAGRPAKAEIYYYSKLVETVDLKPGEDKIFSIPEEPNVKLHQSADGTIRFEESDCPDKICIKTGKIASIGQSAACLPNGMLVKIVPSGERSEDDLDIVAG
jgi:hypothetical protein